MGLINREDLIAAAKVRCEGCYNRKGTYCNVCEVQDMLDLIEDQPAVEQPTVVRGRWISWEEAENCVSSPFRHECSVCHDPAQVLINGIELLSDYCPNCGAKMEV